MALISNPVGMIVVDSECTLAPIVTFWTPSENRFVHCPPIVDDEFQAAEIVVKKALNGGEVLTAYGAVSAEPRAHIDHADCRPEGSGR